MIEIKTHKNNYFFDSGKIKLKMSLVSIFPGFISLVCIISLPFIISSELGPFETEYFTLSGNDIKVIIIFAILGYISSFLTNFIGFITLSTNLNINLKKNYIALGNAKFNKVEFSLSTYKFPGMRNIPTFVYYTVILSNINSYKKLLITEHRIKEFVEIIEENSSLKPKMIGNLSRI